MRVFWGKGDEDQSKRGMLSKSGNGDRQRPTDRAVRQWQTNRLLFFV